MQLSKVNGADKMKCPICKQEVISEDESKEFNGQRFHFLCFLLNIDEIGFKVNRRRRKHES